MANFTNHSTVSNQPGSQFVNGDIVFEAQASQEVKDNQCLCDLKLTNPEHDKARIEWTKDNLLRESFIWILDDAGFKNWRDNDHTKLLWIKGDPGKGKTMLVIGLIDELSKKLGAQPEAGVLSYFFCQATDSKLRSAVSVLRGLIYLLAIHNRALIRHIRKIYDVSGPSMFDEANTFHALRQILSDMVKDPTIARVYLMVDALDECDFDRSQLLDLIAGYTSGSSRVKWLVSSRNKPDIEEQLMTADARAKISLELNSSHISRAVKTFIDFKVSKLRAKKAHLYKDWISENIRDGLYAKSNGTFLWVALVFKKLAAMQFGNPLEVLEKLPPGLPPLYERMIKEILDGEDSGVAESCRRILASLTLAYRPIHLKELVNIAGLQERPDDVPTLKILVALCGSFLIVQEDTVYFIHQSAKDYLATLGGNPRIFPLGQAGEHGNILARSLEAMSNTLRRDICGLKMPGALVVEVGDVDLGPLAHIRYACSYWIDHLCQASSLSQNETGLYDEGLIHKFFQFHFLHWLEALSLGRMMSKGVIMVKQLETLLKGFKANVDSLVAIIQDAKRFIVHHRFIIEMAPLQIYASAILYSPRKSLIKNQFLSQGPKWMEQWPDAEENWSRSLQTLEGHVHSVVDVAFSPNSQWLASASEDRTIRLWDAETGALQQTLRGHSGSVNAVAFSPKNQWLASASNDMTIRLWDAETGALQQTLRGHSGFVNAVAISPKNQWLASASSDKTIRLWGVKTGASQQTLGGHSGSVDAVAISPNNQWLASASDDETIRLWDVETGALQQTIESQACFYNAVAFSPNNQWLAFIFNNETIRLWGVETEALQHTFEGHSGFLIIDLAFSPNNQWLASTSFDGTIRLWDAETGALQQTLKGHTGAVSAVAFMPNGEWLASASRDKSIRLWDVEIGVLQRELEGHIGEIRAVLFSHNGRWLASSYDEAIRLWDAETGALHQTLKVRRAIPNAVAFSPNNLWFVSISEDETIRLWNVETGALQQTLQGHDGWVRALEFSPNSQWLASAFSDGTIQLWGAETGTLRQTLKAHSSLLGSLAFSPNSQWLAFASTDNIIQLRGAETGILEQTLNGHIHDVIALAFSPNIQWLACASRDKTIRIWNADTGTLEQTLKGDIHDVIALAFSPNSQWLASAYDFNSIRIWNANTGALQQTFENYVKDIDAVTLSLNNSQFSPSYFREYLQITKKFNLTRMLEFQISDVKALKFSSDGRHLLTNLGSIKLPFPHLSSPHLSSSQPMEFSGYALYSSSWITWNNHRILWLPQEYRPSCQAFHGNCLAMGHVSGQVTIINFKEDICPIDS